MKKLSISLFTVLAILLAVSSAFTTKTKILLPNKWERFGVTANQVAAAASASAALSSIIGDTFNQVFGSQISSINNQINRYNSDSTHQE